MAKQFFVPLDLTKLELQNAVVQVLGSDPSSPVEGQIYYNSGSKKLRQYNGTTWTEYGASAGDVTQSSNSGGAGRMKISAGANKVISDLSGVVGIIKTDTNGVVSAATASADYAPATSGSAILKGNGSGGFSSAVSSTDYAPATSGSAILKGNGSGGFSSATAGTDYVTGSSTNTFINKTFDAAGSGNALSNIATSMFASNVVDTDGTLAANSDTRMSSQKAVKTYVDTIAQGVRWKDSVRAATTAAGTLATSFENGDAIDGVTLATGDRILIKDQAAGAENGIYTVNASGAPTRATDADTATEVRGMVIPVREGTTNADTAWINTNDAAVTLGTTALTFTNFISANVPTASTTVVGKVQLATQVQAEAKSSSTVAVTPASLTTFTRKYTATIGDGSTTAITVTDSLSTQDKIANVRDASTNVEVLCDITYASTTTTTFTFAVAPATNAYKITIIG